MSDDVRDIDCIVVGKNQELSLGKCLGSVQASKYAKGNVHIFYVDLGSKDQSVKQAKEAGVKVIKASSLGEGLTKAWSMGKAPFVQIMLASSLMDEEWLSIATKRIRPDWGALRGRRDAPLASSFFDRVLFRDANLPQEGLCDLLGQEGFIRRFAVESKEKVTNLDAALMGKLIFDHGYSIHYIEAPMSRSLGPCMVWEKYFMTLYDQGKDQGVKHNGSFKRGVVSLCLILVALLGGVLSLWSLVFVLAAAIVLAYPRIFEVEHWAQFWGVSHEDGAEYALHQSLRTLPETWGTIVVWIRQKFGKKEGGS